MSIKINFKFGDQLRSTNSSRIGRNVPRMNRRIRQMFPRMNGKIRQMFPRMNGKIRQMFPSSCVGCKQIRISKRSEIDPSIPKKNSRDFCSLRSSSRLKILDICIINITSKVEGRRSRGKSRAKATLNQRLPEGTKWRDQESKVYYENPAGAKITKASHFDLEYILGHKIYFMCIAEGFPRPHITWFKDGAEIYFHNQLMIHEWNNGNKTKSKMEIDPATQMDAGIYDCYAENQYNYDRRTFRTDFISIFD